LYVLKQNYFALVGVIKDWMSQNARYNCENEKNTVLPFTETSEL